MSKCGRPRIHDARDREIYRLYQADTSHEAIAERYGLAKSSIGTVIHRIKKRMEAEEGTARRVEQAVA